MKLKQSLICSLFAVSMLFPGTSALAADVPESAMLWNGRITVEGNYGVDFWNEAEEGLYCLNYNGSVYVPLRTAAEWMGKDMAKSPDGQTFTLSGSKEPVYRDDAKVNCFNLTGQAILDKYSTPMPVTLLADAKLVVDGTTAALTDAAGKQLNLIEWNNEPYLPVRTASQLLGMTLKYVVDNDNKSKFSSIYMRTPLTEEQQKACNAYVETLEPVFYQLNELFHQKAIETLQDASEAYAEYVAAMNTLKNTPKPDCRFIDPLYRVMQARIDKVMPALDRVQQLIQSGMDIETIDTAIAADWQIQPGAKFQKTADTRGAGLLCLDAASAMLTLREVITETR